MDKNYYDPSIPIDIQQSLTRNMPYNPRTVIPNADMLGYMDDPNTFGSVNPRMPSSILMNRNRQGDLPNTFGGHELEHQLQFNVNSRYKNGYDGQVIDELYNRANPKDKWKPEYSEDLYKRVARSNVKSELTDQLKLAGNNKGLNAYLSKLSGVKTAPYIGGMGGDQYSLKEQFAELSAIEQYVKKDLTQDPYVREHFFGNKQHLIDVYKATTGLRTNRLDAKDLPPMTAQQPASTSWRSTLSNMFK